VSFQARVIIEIGVAIGWVCAAVRWSIRRFGRKAAVVTLALGLAICGVLGREYWLDEPNRRLASQIEELPGCYTANSRGFLTGKVDHVYISSKASDAEVLRFTELDGLQDLKILFVNGARLSDATARCLGRLKSLKHLTLHDTEISEEIEEELRNELPECEIEVK
jgi:hypothetical protein